MPRIYLFLKITKKLQCKLKINNIKPGDRSFAKEKGTIKQGKGEEEEGKRK